MTSDRADIRCPLCDWERPFIIRRFDRLATGRRWVSLVGFDPLVAGATSAPEIVLYRCSRCVLEYYRPEFDTPTGFYERLSRYEWYYEANKWEFERTLDALGRLPEPRAVLEIGCGDGQLLEKLVDWARPVGLEVSEEAIRASRAKGLDVSNRSIAEIGSTFSAIILSQVLEHFVRPREMLESIVEALEPGGLLLVAVPNPRGYLSEVDNVLLDLPPHHATRWPRETFEYVARVYDLDLVALHEEPLRFDHYGHYIGHLRARGRSAAPSGLLPRISSGVRATLDAVLNQTLLPFFYPGARRDVPGQTHFAEFRRR